MTFNPVHSVAVVKASADMGLVNTISLLLRSGLAHKISSKFLSVSTILHDLHTVHTLPGVSPVNQVRQGDELLCDIVNMYLSRQDKWAGEDKAVLQTVFKELESVRDKIDMQSVKHMGIQEADISACRAYLYQAQCAYKKIKEMIHSSTINEALKTMREVANPDASPIEPSDENLIDLSDVVDPNIDDLITHLDAMNLMGMVIFETVSTTSADSTDTTTNVDEDALGGVDTPTPV